MGEMILINVRKEKEKGSEDEEEREEKGSRREVYKHISQEKTEHKPPGLLQEKCEVF